jgi:peptidoglycan/xylan/chitin deacetylase (PgdA/CDA1 family)
MIKSMIVYDLCLIRPKLTGLPCKKSQKMVYIKVLFNSLEYPVSSTRSPLSKTSFFIVISVIIYAALVAAYGIVSWPKGHMYVQRVPAALAEAPPKPSTVPSAAPVLAAAVPSDVTMVPSAPINTPSPTIPAQKSEAFVPPFTAGPATQKLRKGDFPILMYHYVGRSVDPKKDELGWKLSVTGDSFDQQLSFIEQHGFHTVTMSQYQTGKLPEHPIALTFDDGYADAYSQAYPRLKAHNMVGTFYIISGKTDVNYVTGAQIKEMKGAGMEIAAHTITHRDLKDLSAADQWKEIQGSKQQLELLTGAPVTDFCYPIGHLNKDTLALVRQAGFLTATTTQGGVANAGYDSLLLPRLRMGPYSNLVWMQKELSY